MLKVVIYGSRAELLLPCRNAVKKFVYENHGLVKRMYGDLRHIFVMQSELENEIELEDIKQTADKYSKAFNTHNKRQMKAKKELDRKNVRSENEPYFRPAQRPSALNSKQKTKPPKTVAKEQSDNDVLLDNLIKSNIEAIAEGFKAKEGNFSQSPESSQKTTKLTSVPSSSTTPSSLSKIKGDVASERAEDTAKYEEIASSEKNDEATADKVVLNLFNNISSVLSSTTVSSATANDEKLSSTLTESIISNTLEKVEEEIEVEALNDLVQVASGVGEALTDNEVSDRNNSKEPQTTTETQLFQDTVQKEKEPTPVVNRRGV